MFKPLNEASETVSPPSGLRALVPLLPALLVLASLLGLHALQTPDSENYLQAAENLRSGRGFGAGFLLWPPLYPALLSLHSWVGIPDANRFAALLGDAGALATLLGAWAIGRRVFRSPIALALSLLALTSIDRFGFVFQATWSEAVFVPLSVWLAWAWTDFLEHGRKLLPACVLLALAMLARHVGVVLAIAMAITCLREPPPRRVRGLVAIAVACLPYALWLLRTHLLCGYAMGPREMLAHPDLARQVALFGGVAAHWLFPHAYCNGVGLGIAAFALEAIALWLARESRFFAFAALVLLGHSVLTVYSASRLTLDVDARTLFPVFWLALFLVTHFLEHAVAGKRWAQWLLAACVVPWFAASNAIANALA